MLLYSLIFFGLDCFFQNLLGAISLRRIKDTDIGTKSMIKLPPKTVLILIFLQRSVRYMIRWNWKGKTKCRNLVTEIQFCVIIPLCCISF